jgi:hypothetical protein
MRGPEIIILPILFSMIAFIAWTAMSTLQRRHHLKLMTDFNSRLLERIGSVKDFSEFLQTDGGAKFMNSLTVERGASGPRERILRTTTIGIVVSALGLGFLFLSRHFGTDAYSSDMDEVLLIFGVIALSIGLGCLVSAAVSYYLARVLGVLEQNRRAAANVTVR